MRISYQVPSSRVGQTSLGFTFVEVLVAMGALGVMVIALYSGITGGFSLIRMARENLRATQVMVEKMETVRLYNWDELCSNGFILTPFQAPFYSEGGVTSAPIYYGTIAITNPPMSTPYTNDLKWVVVNITWTSMNMPRQRTISTFVSRYGLQNYIY